MTSFGSQAIRRREFLALGVGGGAALLLAACGSGQTSAATPSPGGQTAGSSAAAASQPASGAPASVEGLAAYQGSDRQQVLEGGARKEASLTWYTSLAGSVVSGLTDGFKAKYPFVQTSVFRAAEDKLIQRATQEAQANKAVFDVLESPISAILIFNQSKLLTPFYSPALGGIPADFKTQASGNVALSATDRIGLIGFGYNTTLIPDAAVPKILDDLLNPGLTGKMALAGTTTGYRWVGSVLHAMGSAKGQQFLGQLESQQKVTVQQVSGKALLDLVAKGEVPASPTIYREHVEEAAAAKAPVKWVPLEPVVANVGQLAIDAKAPHPHAALLYIDYVLGEGQQVLEKLFYAVPTKLPSAKYWIPEQGRTTTEIEQDLNHWGQIFKTTFR